MQACFGPLRACGSSALLSLFAGATLFALSLVPGALAFAGWWKGRYDAHHGRWLRVVSVVAWGLLCLVFLGYYLSGLAFAPGLAGTIGLYIVDRKRAQEQL